MTNPHLQIQNLPYIFGSSGVDPCGIYWLAWELAFKYIGILEDEGNANGCILA